jgi:hypothetical protein
MSKLLVVDDHPIVCLLHLIGSGDATAQFAARLPACVARTP